jgi:isopropylmalate/homocitrate/citramalate synthase
MVSGTIKKVITMTQQTAVEWLVKSLSDRMYIHCPDFGHTIIDKLVEQAKEIEKKQSQPEISDEEIEKAAFDYVEDSEEDKWTATLTFIAGCKWYREQLKKLL